MSQFFKIKFLLYKLTCLVVTKMAPVLRNLLRRQTQRDFVIAAVLSAVAPITWYFTVQYPRKKRYEEFYKYEMFL